MEEDIVFEWENIEFKEKKRSNDWYWALGIIAVAGSIAAMIFSNFLFGIFILLATIILIFLSTQKEKKQTYRITTNSIILGDEHFLFSEIKAFWLDDSNDEFTLFLHTKNLFNPVLTVHFDSYEQGDIIYEALHKDIKEKYLREPISHMLMERLGF